MALQQKLDKKHEDNDYGYNFDDAYFKIVNVKIDVERNQVNIEVRGYASKTARNIENTIGIYKKIFKCTLEDLKLEKLPKKDISINDAIKTNAYKYIKKNFLKNAKDT
jgi:DNA relaxase NicK